MTVYDLNGLGVASLPTAWRRRRLKDVATIGAGVPAPKPHLLSTSGRPFLRVSDLSRAIQGWCHETRDALSGNDLAVIKQWPAGTIVFPKSGESIRTNVRARLAVPMSVVSHLACVAARPGVSIDYLFWLLCSIDFEDHILQTTLPALSLDAIGGVEVQIPSWDEQESIASFLNYQTSAIDSQRRVLGTKTKLLKELRDAMITQAVTRGLNAAEQLVKSGMSWAPLTPQSWPIERMKTIFKETSIKGHPHLPLLAATQHAGVILKSEMTWRTVEAGENNRDGFKVVHPNDFVISLRSFEGGIEHSSVSGIISSAYSVLKLNQMVNHPPFWRYFLKSDGFISSLGAHKTGIRDGQAISFSTLSNDKIAVPPKNIQIEISNFLDEKTSIIDDQMVVIDQQERALRDLRAQLILRAVSDPSFI